MRIKSRTKQDRQRERAMEINVRKQNAADANGIRTKTKTRAYSINNNNLILFAYLKVIANKCVRLALHQKRRRNAIYGGAYKMIPNALKFRAMCVDPKTLFAPMVCSRLHFVKRIITGRQQTHQARARDSRLVSVWTDTQIQARSSQTSKCVRKFCVLSATRPS